LACPGDDRVVRADTYPGRRWRLPLVVALCILRGWSIARGLALLLATLTAIVTRKDERREVCTEIVFMVTNKGEPPARLRGRPVRIIAQQPRRKYVLTTPARSCVMAITHRPTQWPVVQAPTSNPETRTS
jgi:hypothetical protein